MIFETCAIWRMLARRPTPPAWDPAHDQSGDPEGASRCWNQHGGLVSSRGADTALSAHSKSRTISSIMLFSYSPQALQDAVARSALHRNTAARKAALEVDAVALSSGHLSPAKASAKPPQRHLGLSYQTVHPCPCCVYSLSPPHGMALAVPGPPSMPKCATPGDTWPPNHPRGSGDTSSIRPRATGAPSWPVPLGTLRDAARHRLGHAVVTHQRLRRNHLELRREQEAIPGDG